MTFSEALNSLYALQFTLGIYDHLTLRASHLAAL